jgi:hypothetical protein
MRRQARIERGHRYQTNAVKGLIDAIDQTKANVFPPTAVSSCSRIAQSISARASGGSGSRADVTRPTIWL